MLTSKTSQRSYSKEKTIEALKSNCFDYKDMLSKVMKVISIAPMSINVIEQAKIFNKFFSKEEIKELSRLLNS